MGTMQMYVQLYALLDEVTQKPDVTENRLGALMLTVRLALRVDTPIMRWFLL